MAAASGGGDTTSLLMTHPLIIPHVCGGGVDSSFPKPGHSITARVERYILVHRRHALGEAEDGGDADELA